MCGINLIGVTGGIADVRGQFKITIRDIANNPVPGSSVVIDFGPCATDACKEEGHRLTLSRRCKEGCKIADGTCMGFLLFDFGAKEWRILFAAIGGAGTVAMGLLAAIMLIIGAIRPSRGVATAALVLSILALIGGAGFVIAAGMVAKGTSTPRTNSCGSTPPERVERTIGSSFPRTLTF